ncbi:MAG: alpha/beta hydrolase [Actinobacteria bacterium]|nr:alpha/beta hydrolase [Actinomycetota bacterium]
MTQPTGQPIDVPLPDGQVLRALRWGGRGPLVVALHGITQSAVTFQAMAERLVGGSGDAGADSEATVVAPDLRGRGGSAEVPGPYGMAVHAGDVAALLDHLGADEATVVGHSMGAQVAVVFAARHPARTVRLVLVDGGLPLPRPPEDQVDATLEAVLGPALERLSRTFSSVEEYLDYWRAHPAFARPGVWNRHVEACMRYDLEGSAPSLRPRVSEETVRADGADTLTSPELDSALRDLACPVTLLRAPRGMLDQPEPLLSDEAVARARAAVGVFDDAVVEGTNHYTILLGDQGATAVADRVRALLASDRASR